MQHFFFNMYFNHVTQKSLKLRKLPVFQPNVKVKMCLFFKVSMTLYEHGYSCISFQLTSVCIKCGDNKCALSQHNANSHLDTRSLALTCIPFDNMYFISYFHEHKVLYKMILPVAARLKQLFCNYMQWLELLLIIQDVRKDVAI